MNRQHPWPLAIRIPIFVVLSPFFAAYGALSLARAGRRAFRFGNGVRAALADTITCPNGHGVDATGRFECGACRSTYHGWVGRCGVCGAGAAWTPCPVCGVSIPLPWN